MAERAVSPRRVRTHLEAHAAQESRIRLLKKLAPDGRCAVCRRRHRRRHGDPDRPWVFLEVDHVGGRDWKPSSHSQLGRVRRYWREYEAGVKLRALCRRCNARCWGGREAQLALPGTGGDVDY